MKPLHKFLSLSVSEQYLFFRVAAVLLLLRLMLRALPLRTVCMLVSRFARKPLRTGVDERRFEDLVVRAAAAAGRRILGQKPCLPQALAVKLFLKRKGNDATLIIGVIKDENEQLMAHAWVERHGRVLIGGAASPSVFTPLPPFRI